jgi:hypothetical protein
MIARYNAGQPQQPDSTPAGEPALILGKFKSPEDLAKAYTELEKRLGAPPEAKPDPAAPAPVADGKVDWNAVKAEVEESGALSDTSRAALTAMGIPEAVIQGYEASATRAATEFRSALETEAGGQEQFETIRMWAATNLSEAERKALQSMVGNGLESAKIAVATMRQRYEAANGAPPVAPVGGRAPGTSSVGYGSTAEMMRDMANPLYSNDPAFRKSVEDKLAVTTAF